MSCLLIVSWVIEVEYTLTAIPQLQGENKQHLKNVRNTSGAKDTVSLVPWVKMTFRHNVTTPALALTPVIYNGLYGTMAAFHCGANSGRYDPTLTVQVELIFFFEHIKQPFSAYKPNGTTLHIYSETTKPE